MGKAKIEAAKIEAAKIEAAKMVAIQVYRNAISGIPDNVKSIEKLIRMGLTPNDTIYNLPLLVYAAASSSESTKKSVDYLINKGASLDKAIKTAKEFAKNQPNLGFGASSSGREIIRMRTISQLASRALPTLEKVHKEILKEEKAVKKKEEKEGKRLAKEVKFREKAATQIDEKKEHNLLVQQLFGKNVDPKSVEEMKPVASAHGIFKAEGSAKNEQKSEIPQPLSITY